MSAFWFAPRYSRVEVVGFTTAVLLAIHYDQLIIGVGTLIVTAFAQSVAE